MIIPADIDFAKYIEDMSFLEAQELHWSDHWGDSLVDRLLNGEGTDGDLLPWQKTHNHFRLREGELTIWAGINGHRKSMILGQVMLNLAKHTRVCIASLEMKPESTLLRMAQQAATCFPSSGFAKQFADWGHERICIYDQLDTVEAVKILGMVHYSAKELGCKHVVIDSLTKCGLLAEDYAAEKKFIDRLQWAAKHYNIHIHLVAHMRKGDNEAVVPNKFSVKGTGAITDLADNVLICWKDKIKERAKLKQKTGQTLSEEEVKHLDKPDQILVVAKQRNGEWEDNFLFWFDDKSLQFVEYDGAKPVPLRIENKAAA